MKKKIILIAILALILILTAGLIYLNKVYLPVKLKAYLTQQLESSTGYSAKIGNLNYHLLKGLVIKDIAVYDGTADARNTILTVQELSFNFLFLPLVREQKIIIPWVTIRKPYLHIRYHQDGTFNFSRIFTSKPAARNKQKWGLSFFIYKINLMGGKCLLEDEHFTPVFSRDIADLNIGLALGPSSKASFVMQGNIPHPDGTFGRISLKGDYRIPSEEMNAQLNLANLSFKEFEPCLKKLPFTIAGGNIDSAALSLNLKNKILALQGIVLTKNVQLAKDELALSGDIVVEPSFQYALDKKELDYKINFKLLGVTLEGIKYIEKITNAVGNLQLTKNSLTAQGIQLQALNSDFRLSGNVDFKVPYLKLRFESAAANLETVFALLSAPKDLKLSGTAAVRVDVEGDLNIAPLAKKAVFNLTTATFKAPLLKEPLNNIAGKIILTEEGADWAGLSFNYRNTAYSSSGKLLNFKEPQLNFALSSKDLDLKSNLKIKDKDIKINALEAKYLNSYFNILGDINIRNSSNSLLNLSAKLNLSLPDTFAVLPAKISGNLKKLKLDGRLNINGTLSGEAKDCKNWKISAKAAADLISVYGLKFSNLSFGVEQQQETLQLLNFSVSPAYSGIINLALSASLKGDNPGYILKFSANGIDLSKLKSDIGLKDKDIAGIIYIDANLNGEFKNLDTLKGLGFISVKDGKLWQINLFKGLGELFLLPEYRGIVFTKANGEFEVENRLISTDDLKLESPELILDWSGNMGFDGALDFTVYTNANKNVIKDSPDLRKFLAAIVGELSGAIAVKVSGTIKEPKFGFLPMPLDLLKNIKNFILGK
ncbi:DUF748 domain-containing protein [bacterium]|nr:MAG: DUF748 domain-containing protein [bacterium]